MRSFFSWVSLRPNLIFFFLLTIMCVSYYDGIFDKEPLGTHLWRQTDCLSLTRNYANGANFFEPELDILLADGYSTGKTAGEFPILYYLVGKSWSVFGESVMLYRIFYFLILISGIFAFYRSLLIFNLGNFWSTVLSLLLFTSPVFIVYGVSFLTDVPAFCFVLIALYFTLRYFKNESKLSLGIAMMFFTLAGLLKVSSLILFICLSTLFLLEIIRSKLNKSTNSLRHPKLLFISLISVFALVFSWYYYASYYNASHQFKYTFNSVYPFWLMDSAGYNNLVEGMLNYSLIIFFSSPMIILLLLISMVNLFIGRYMPWYLYVANVLILLGSLAYFLLWAPLFENHDYYFIALLILFISSFVPLLTALKKARPKLFHSKMLSVIFSLFLMYNFVYALSVVKLKTRAASGDFPIVMNETFVGNMRWVNYAVTANWLRYKDIQKELIKLGVQANDRVICLSDDSFSVALYFLNKRGWTNFMVFSKSEEIQQLIDVGAKYLLIADKNQLEMEYIQPFLESFLGEYREIRVYKL